MKRRHESCQRVMPSWKPRRYKTRRWEGATAAFRRLCSAYAALAATCVAETPIPLLCTDIPTVRYGEGPKPPHADFAEYFKAGWSSQIERFAHVQAICKQSKASMERQPKGIGGRCTLLGLGSCGASHAWQPRKHLAAWKTTLTLAKSRRHLLQYQPLELTDLLLKRQHQSSSTA